MTRSIDAYEQRERVALGGDWRRRCERSQELAVPTGSVLVSCSAPFGKGGLGRHLAEVVDALERAGADVRSLDGVRARALRAPLGRARWIGGVSAAAAPLARRSTTWRAWCANVEFDCRSVGALRSAEHLVAFGGQALEQFRAAQLAGVSRSLMSATAHVATLRRRHELARRNHPYESSWADRLVGRSLAEYERAERIYVSSRYALESFLKAGVSEERMSLFPLTPAPRFRPGPLCSAEAAGGTFDVVYVGGLSVVKGVPLLIDAFSRLAHSDMRLLLVGGPESRPMRRYLQRASARDQRIVVGPGDPLPLLRRARLYVHPSYSDGFGYAPAEALACGVPAIVSEDTGMKELIEPGLTGLVLPTGDARALAEALDCAYRGEILELGGGGDAAR
ncbi:MAG TPA: glycosyltransferase family 4 protein [Solirubrobacteraceae bacterium]|jgi:glycosyltransferase involved in cell wall biosynthesis|nr:glycosyltransferase family 4 protein [Solirubrobacteraceae bacterium]